MITLGDIADIRRTFKDASGFSTINGQKTIAIDVRKRLNANAIETVAAVRAAVASLPRPVFAKYQYRLYLR